MGVIKKRDLASYWSTDDVVGTPFFRTKMSRNRFQAIMSNLHLADIIFALSSNEDNVLEDNVFSEDNVKNM